MFYFQAFVLFSLVFSVHPDRMDMDLPCPVDTFSQDYSSQIYGSPLVIPPLTITVNYDKPEANEQKSGTNERTVEVMRKSNLLHNIFHLPSVIADSLVQ